MKRILTAVVLIPVVLVVVLKAPDWLFSFALGVFALATAHEYFNLTEHYGFKPIKPVTFLLIGLPFLYWTFQPFETSIETLIFIRVFSLTVPAITFLFGPLLILTFALRASDLSTALPQAAVSALAIPYTALPFVSLLAIRNSYGGAFFLLYLFAVVWSGDIFAYYVGRTIGRHKLAPRISPGKTWEGSIASLIGGIFIGLLWLRFGAAIPGLERWHLLARSGWDGILPSALINIAAQLGDLVESMLKRGANVKDSGSLLPGHGGILDRVDALLLAAPVLFFYAVFVR